MLTSTDEPSDEAIKGEPLEIRPRNTVRSDLVIACEAAAEDNWLGSRERVLSGELAIELTLKRATIWYRRPPGTPVESSRSNFRCHSLC